MHTTQTFILRLFVDQDNPEILRGSMLAITQKKPQPFANEQMLAALLRQMITETAPEKDGDGQIEKG
jgi:hypothetical protein